MMCGLEYRKHDTIQRRRTHEPNSGDRETLATEVASRSEQEVTDDVHKRERKRQREGKTGRELVDKTRGEDESLRKDEEVLRVRRGCERDMTGVRTRGVSNRVQVHRREDLRTGG